jgi:arginase
VRIDDLSLLLPEWQGYGVDAFVASGARQIATLFDAGAFLEIDAPDEEALTVEQGVLGLSSIAGRARRTLAALDERRPSRIFTVGGTCGVELAPVSYLNSRYRGDLAVVWLDAHADLNTPESSPSGHFHGMVLRTLLGAGPAILVEALRRPLIPAQVVLAGARDLDRDEVTFVSDAALSLLSPADVLVPDRIAGRIRAGGFTRVYLHLDLDVLDPVEFPDALVSTPNGLSRDNVVATVRELAARFDVVGFSVVEFRPRSADALSRLAQLLDRCGIAIGVLGARR